MLWPGRLGRLAGSSADSELSSACLRGLFALGVRIFNLCISIPTQSAQPLRQDGVGEVIARIHPVGVHGAEVLDLQLDQGTSELRRVTQLLCELISLELISSAEDVHEKLDDGVHRRKSVREEDESDYDGEFLVEPEGFVERTVVYEDGEQGKYIEEVRLSNVNLVHSDIWKYAYLGDAKEPRGVPETPMSKFVCQDCYNLLRLALLDQGVVDDNVLLPWHTKEIGVAVSTSFATINDVQLVERELQALGKCFDASLQLARFERGEFVEQGKDRDGIDGDHKDLQSSSK